MTPVNKHLTRQSPICFVARHDLQAREAVVQGKQVWLIKDPVGQTYFRLTSEQYCLLGWLDGGRSARQLLVDMRQAFPDTRLDEYGIQRLAVDFYQKGLAWSSRAGQGAALNFRRRKQSWSRCKQTLSNVFFVRLPGFDPSWMLRVAGHPIAWLLHPMIAVAALLLIALVWTWMLVNVVEMQQRLPRLESLFEWRSVLLLWVILGITKVVHELGHAVACQKAGGECHQIGVAFLFFSPCLYCDVSDSWLLASKWRRIGIALAGVYVELLISVCAFLLWCCSAPGLLNHIFFLTFATTTISSVLVNLNPLLKFDGYYVLSDLWEIPNLRRRADSWLHGQWLRLLFGIPDREPDEESRSVRRCLAVYAGASLLYRVGLVLLITWSLYLWLKPYRLENFGLALGVVCCVSPIYTWGKRLWDAVREHRNSGEAIRVGRVAMSGLFLAGLLLGFFFFPASIPLSVPVRLEFTDAVNLYCDQTTRLVAIRVKNGQCVDQGDLLLEMRDPEIDLAISQANQQRRQLEIDIQKHRVMLNADQTLLLQRQLDLLNEEIARLSDRKQQLNIFAPTSGTVIESEPRPASAANDARLPKWDGSPLSPMNLGCQVNQGTLLLSIATRPVFRGVLRIDQLDIHSIQVGQTVRIKLDHLPFESFDGRVEQIFRATGGESVAMAGKQPVDPDQLPPFQAIVSLTGLPDHCLSGMNGRAKVNIAPQTAAGWLWKHVKSIFNFQS